MTIGPPQTSLPPVLATVGFLTRPTATFRRFGRISDVFVQRIAGMGDTVVFTHPDDVRTIMTFSPSETETGTQASALGPLLGPNSVLTLQGPEHLRHRKMLLPFFRGAGMRTWGQTIEDLTHDRIDQWRPGSVVVTQEDTQAITLDTMLAIVFGTDMLPHQGDISDVVIQLTKRMGSGWRAMVDTVAASRGRIIGPMVGVKRDLDLAVFAQLARHRALPSLEGRSDVLSHLLQARDDDGQLMTDAELRDEIVTLLLVGHETTSTSLAWAMERLARHPDEQRRLREAAQADPPDDGYIDALTSEVLRVRPVVPIVSRNLLSPMTIGGYDLPVGTTVSVNIYLLNHRADVYGDPFTFRPQRFVRQRPETYSWLPFGGGVRRCIGAAFAETEMRHVLRVIGQRVTFTPDRPESERSVLRSVTFAPARGGSVRISSVAPRPPAT